MEMETLGKFILWIAFMLVFLTISYTAITGYNNSGGLANTKDIFCWATNVMRAKGTSMFPTICRERIVEADIDEEKVSNLMRTCWWMYGQGYWDLGSKGRGFLTETAKTYLAALDYTHSCYVFMPNETIDVNNLIAYMRTHDKGYELEEDKKNSDWNFLQKGSRYDGLCFDYKDGGQLQKDKVYYIIFKDDRRMDYINAGLKEVNGIRDMIFVSSNKKFDVNFIQFMLDNEDKGWIKWGLGQFLSLIFWQEKPCFNLGDEVVAKKTKEQLKKEAIDFFNDAAGKVEKCALNKKIKQDTISCVCKGSVIDYDKLYSDYRIKISSDKGRIKMKLLSNNKPVFDKQNKRVEKEIEGGFGKIERDKTVPYELEEDLNVEGDKVYLKYIRNPGFLFVFGKKDGVFVVEPHADDFIPEDSFCSETSKEAEDSEEKAIAFFNDFVGKAKACSKNKAKFESSMGKCNCDNSIVDYTLLPNGYKVVLEQSEGLTKFKLLNAFDSVVEKEGVRMEGDVANLLGSYDYNLYTKKISFDKSYAPGYLEYAKIPKRFGGETEGIFIKPLGVLLDKPKDMPTDNLCSEKLKDKEAEPIEKEPEKFVEINKLCTEQGSICYCDYYDQGMCRLKKDATDKLVEAMIKAKEEGVGLLVYSAYRTPAHQEYLLETSENEACGPDENGNYDHCPHVTAGAIDVILKGKTKAEMTDADKEQLLSIMSSAGWVRYENEFWHFEYGTNRWSRAQAEGVNSIV